MYPVNLHEPPLGAKAVMIQGSGEVVDLPGYYFPVDNSFMTHWALSPEELMALAKGEPLEFWAWGGIPTMALRVAGVDYGEDNL